MQARTAAAAAIVPALQQRWPRLALAPADSLLLLLEQLPAYFRAAAAGRPMQLPLPLLDVLFKGVTCLLPGRGKDQLQTSRMQAGDTNSSNGQQRQQQQTQGSKHTTHRSSRQSSVPEAPSTAAYVDIKGTSSSAGDVQQQQQQRSMLPLPDTISGFQCEPLSAAETAAAAAAGGLCVRALACTGPWIEGSDSMPAVSEVLHLQQQQQQQQLDGSAAGVRWLPDACPAAVLQSLHAAAAAALQQQTRAAILSAGKLRVSCSCCAWVGHAIWAAA
jgi:hypothetical protein